MHCIPSCYRILSLTSVSQPAIILFAFSDFPFMYIFHEPAHTVSERTVQHERRNQKQTRIQRPEPIWRQPSSARRCSTGSHTRRSAAKRRAGRGVNHSPFPTRFSYFPFRSRTFSLTRSTTGSGTNSLISPSKNATSLTIVELR